jgi:acetylornithine deacetylase/succinyl-diaminopimelate desuccinylase-like protein
MEPTSLDVYRCEKGAYWRRVCAHGESAHGPRSHLGTNAIDIAVESITALNAQTFEDVDEHEILGRPAVNIGCIEGGDNINTVPKRYMFEVDRRVVPAEDMAYVVDETAGIMVNITQNYDFTYEVEELVTASPFETPRNAVVVQSARTTIEHVTGIRSAVSFENSSERDERIDC